MVLDWPAESMEPLLFALKTAVDRLCARMQSRRLAAVRLTVALTLEGNGSSPAPVPLVLARPSSQPKLLLDLFRHRLADLTVPRPVAALCLAVEECCAEAQRQLNLEDAPAGEAALEEVLSRLQSALGEGALLGAALVDSYRAGNRVERAAAFPLSAQATFDSFQRKLWSGPTPGLAAGAGGASRPS